MHLKSFCFILPAEFDEPGEVHRRKVEKLSGKESSSWGCSTPALDFLRRYLQRFFGLKWVSFCHEEVTKKQFSGVFFDAEGVQIQEKVGGENPRIFSYSELYIGSNGFNESEVLGSGGFGRVYRAVLPSDGTVVAVKCLAERGESFEKTFMAELVAVAHLRHRNLVRLRDGIHNEELLLVYDYMPNRSLDRVLFRRPENVDSAPLTWERRKKIVNGLAAALNYLHEQLETQIIHRDVKTSNVMLDSHFNARLGDFGLARWLEHDLQYKPKTPPVLKNRRFRLEETTRIGGTIGYLPPESFQKRSVATAKSDVFSFGIVVLEVVSGRRAVDLTYPDDQIILLDWIRRLSDEGALLQAGDTRLQDGSYKLSEMEQLIRLGLMCTSHDPQSRPSMKWVMEVLSGNIYGKLPDLPSFQSHPLYISLSSATNTSTSNTAATKSSRTTSASTTAFHSSDFVSANAETIYVSAESDTSSIVPSSNRCQPKKTFPVVETPRVITYEEIISATNNFSDSHRVAEVDFGTAYHGFLENRYHVIVKRLGMKTCPALRMRFANEFQNLGRLRHRNLVQLRDVH
ncbi:UNVERIFIED_CONTAM: Receptor like protein kinase S.2 [Sesamum latifolium]|uniref:Receptor like protein kinase S.2 n=1 Tax=Sesamum latifolium TaxID=2727402 RepID=A0AAW2XS45_9LAMI